MAQNGLEEALRGAGRQQACGVYYLLDSGHPLG